MYPTIQLRGQTFELTGIGIILSVFLFVVISYRKAKKGGLDGKQIAYALPTLIIVSYFIGSYGGFVLRSGHLFPYSIVELGQIIIPPEYGFHAGGVIIGVIMSFFMFLYQLPAKTARKKRLDVLSSSLMLSVILLGIFLTLGDHMIGLSTNSQRGIHALTHTSQLNKFAAVLPVGLFLSGAALISYIIGHSIFKQQTLSGRGFGILSLFFFLVSIVLMFQNYPRHGVIKINTISIDINQYILRSLSFLFLIAYINSYRKHPRYLS